MAKVKVRWSKHVEDKIETELSRFGITKESLQDVVSNPDEVLFDSGNGRNVAVNLKRHPAVIYEPMIEDIFIITAIYSSNLETVIKKRKKSGRWL